MNKILYKYSSFTIFYLILTILTVYSLSFVSVFDAYTPIFLNPFLMLLFSYTFVFSFFFMIKKITIDANYIKLMFLQFFTVLSLTSTLSTLSFHRVFFFYTSLFLLFMILSHHHILFSFSLMFISYILTYPFVSLRLTEIHAFLYQTGGHMSLYLLITFLILSFIYMTLDLFIEQ